MVKHLSDEQLKKLTLGGHDPTRSTTRSSAPRNQGHADLVLARTIKGYGVGESVKARTSPTSRRS
jgi:pyruvate dehydrogenase E1 component